MAARDLIDEMFEGARDYSWDIRGECLWSYFFLHTERDVLMRATQELEGDGFKIVGFLEPESDDDDQETLYIQLDRRERHTPDSLRALNTRLYALADRNGVTYDGMEVGPLEDPSAA